MKVVLLLAVLAAEDPEAQPAPATPNRAGLLLGLSGALVAGVGVGLRLAAGGAYDRIDTGHPPFKDYAELRATRASGELMQTAAAACFIGGAAIIVVATVLTLVFF